MNDPNAIIKNRCVGLTGGVATGKSTVAALLRERGFVVFDADQIARAVVAPDRPAHKEIVTAFGPAILSPDGTIDRKKLGSVVFSAEEKRRLLEAITHPRIREELPKLVASESVTIGSNLFFYEAALIFEVQRSGEFFKVISTYCPENVQLDRLTARNALSREEAVKIMRNQMPAATKRDLADIVVDTDCDRDTLSLRVDEALRQIKGFLP